MINFSKKFGEKTCICEYTEGYSYINMYFDYDSKNKFLTIDEQKNVINTLK